MNTTEPLHSIQSSAMNTYPPGRHWTRRGILGCLLLAVLAMGVMPAQAASTLSGTYATPTRQGVIAFVGLRAFRGGMEGRFAIDGKAWPGSTYAAVGGGLGMVWYYGTSGNTAGNALATLQSDGSYSGPIWFFNRAGNTTDFGTVRITFP